MTCLNRGCRCIQAIGRERLEFTAEMGANTLLTSKKTWPSSSTRFSPSGTILLVLAWEVSNTMDDSFCVSALERALRLQVRNPLCSTATQGHSLRVKPLPVC